MNQDERREEIERLWRDPASRKGWGLLGVYYQPNDPRLVVPNHHPTRLDNQFRAPARHPLAPFAHGLRAVAGVAGDSGGGIFRPKCHRQRRCRRRRGNRHHCWAVRHVQPPSQPLLAPNLCQIQHEALEQWFAGNCLRIIQNFNFRAGPVNMDALMLRVNQPPKRYAVCSVFLHLFL